MDEMFKESPFMYAVASIIIVFVVVQSVFFIVRAWKRGRQIGIPLEDLKNTVTSSALFTIAPAIAILATVLTLAGTLGIVLPWIRLSVIGNLQYEVTDPRQHFAAGTASAILKNHSEKDGQSHKRRRRQ